MACIWSIFDRYQSYRCFSTAVSDGTKWGLLSDRSFNFLLLSSNESAGKLKTSAFPFFFPSWRGDLAAVVRWRNILYKYIWLYFTPAIKYLACGFYINTNVLKHSTLQNRTYMSAITHYLLRGMSLEGKQKGVGWMWEDHNSSSCHPVRL